MQEHPSIQCATTQNTATTRAAEIQMSASTAKHTSKAVKLSDSATTSIGKFTDGKD